MTPAHNKEKLDNDSIRREWLKTDFCNMEMGYHLDTNTMIGIADFFLSKIDQVREEERKKILEETKKNYETSTF